MAKFHTSLKAYADTTGADLETIVREAIIELGTSVVMRSPVGNPLLWKPPVAPPGYVGGRFRGNWQYQFGSPTSKPLDVVDASGQISIQRITAGVTSAEAAGVHYIVNNLPYAEVLEYGHSTQAPDGMVRLSVMEFRRYLAAAANGVQQ